MIKGNDFTEVYTKLARLIRDEHEYQSSPRGQLVKESLGVRFEIADPRNRLLYVPERKMALGYTIAEALWYFLGNNKTDWISYYSGFWKNISDDNETANSAYGARIFKPHPRVRVSHEKDDTQWDAAIQELMSDQDTRRAYIHIKSPLDSQARLDVPCTIGMQFFIREKKLHLLVNMRSSDLILGITYDIPAFTMMQELMVLELQSRGVDVEMGRYIHVSNSLHVYERHFEMLDKIADMKLDAEPGPPMPNMPSDTVAAPPWDVLDSLQWSYREGRRLEDPPEDELGEDSYYSDWAKILAIHTLRMRRATAKKVGDQDTVQAYNELISQLRASLDFEGYRSFKR